MITPLSARFCQLKLLKGSGHQSNKPGIHNSEEAGQHYQQKQSQSGMICYADAVYIPAIQAAQPPSGGGLVDAIGSCSPLLKARLGTVVSSTSFGRVRFCRGVDDCVLPSSLDFASRLLGRLPRLCPSLSPSMSAAVIVSFDMLVDSTQDGFVIHGNN